MSRSQKWLAAALAVSVALNLFAAGAFLSRELFGSEHHGWAAKRAAVEVLPPAERERVEAIWERGREALREEFRGMREARQRYRELLTAETFDPAAAQAALDDLHAHKERARASMADRITEIASSLPPAQRRGYFEAFFAAEAQRDAARERRAREREERR